MCKHVSCLISFALILFAASNASAKLVAHWTFDEGSGTIAADSVGGYDGTLIGDTSWVDGKLGGALEFDGAGDYVDCGNDPVFNPSGSFSVTFWAYVRDWSVAWAECMLGKGGDNNRGGWTVRRGGGQTIMFTLAGAGGNLTGNEAPPLNEWVHIAAVYDQENGLAFVYFNGVEVLNSAASGTVTPSTNSLYLGTRGNDNSVGPDAWTPAYFDGMLDDVRFYDNALSQAEIAQVMKGTSPGLATGPSPENGSVDVIRDKVLTWKPGKFANTHNVYFGTEFDDVNEATLTEPLGVTVFEGKDVNNYDPGLLEFGKTYYWRVDEVNAPPHSSTVFQGQVWSFTAEPHSYKIPAQNIIATASSSSDTGDPNATIDESGLDANDMHSTNGEDMWISSGNDVNDVWIRYDFDKIYKLDEMLVWNYNIGFFLAAGCNDVTVEYSEDGQSWMTLTNVPRFSKGSGKSTYEYNTTVDFNEASAKSVRLTAHTNWSGGSTSYYGLSEVRFMYIPVYAREPNPSDQTSDVPVDLTLHWRAGREAAEHKVYISTDQQEVEDGTSNVYTASEPEYGALALDLNRTYYWRVDEVNNAEKDPVWAGPIWSFSTIKYIVVDGFEVGYNNTDANAVWATWVDGYGDDNNGSQTGYDYPGPYLSTANHSGGHSMPLIYNNAGTAAKSEATAQSLDLPIATKDWSIGQPDTLEIWFMGDVNNAPTDQLYVKLNDTKKVYDGNAADIAGTGWTKWDVPLAGMDLSNISTITIGVERIGSTGGQGIVYFDDIRLTLSEPPSNAEGLTLINPSFEDDGESAGTPSGWTGNDVAGGAGTSAGSVSTTDGGYYLWQGNGNYIYQTTNEVISAAGLTYDLKVDVRNSWQADPKIIIYYLDGNNRVVLGSTTLPSNGNSWPTPVTMEVTATTTAASVGKKLGVELTIDNYPGNYWAHYDNVQLSQTE